jgi:hypothetical protein
MTVASLFRTHQSAGGFVIPQLWLTSAGEQQETVVKRPDGMPVGKPFQPGRSGNKAGRPDGQIAGSPETLSSPSEKHKYVDDFVKSVLRCAVPFR